MKSKIITYGSLSFLFMITWFASMMWLLASPSKTIIIIFVLSTILAIIFYRKTIKLENIIKLRKHKLFKSKYAHYLDLFKTAVEERNIGKTEYMYEHFLKKTQYSDFCNGIIVGLRILSNSNIDNEHGINDLKDIIGEFNK